MRSANKKGHKARKARLELCRWEKLPSITTSPCFFSSITFLPALF